MTAKGLILDGLTPVSAARLVEGFAQQLGGHVEREERYPKGPVVLRSNDFFK